MISEPKFTLDNLRRKDKGTDYQQFAIDVKNKTLIPSGKHRTKFEMVRNIDLRGMRVLDLGCDKGLYSYMACKNGAHHVVANDIRYNLVQYRNILFKILGLPVQNTSNNVFLENKQYDYVLALAMLHEVENLTLREKIYSIRRMSKKGSIIEFCEDYSEKFDDWSLGKFLKCVRSEYKTIELVGEYPAIGDYKGTRYIYDCCCD